MVGPWGHVWFAWDQLSHPQKLMGRSSAGELVCELPEELAGRRDHVPRRGLRGLLSPDLAAQVVPVSGGDLSLLERVHWPLRDCEVTCSDTG